MCGSWRGWTHLLTITRSWAHDFLAIIRLKIWGWQYIYLPNLLLWLPFCLKLFVNSGCNLLVQKSILLANIRLIFSYFCFFLNTLCLVLINCTREHICLLALEKGVVRGGTCNPPFVFFLCKLPTIIRWQKLVITLSLTMRPPFWKILAMPLIDYLIHVNRLQMPHKMSGKILSQSYKNLGKLTGRMSKNQCHLKSCYFCHHWWCS